MLFAQLTSSTVYKVPLNKIIIISGMNFTMKRLSFYPRGYNAIACDESFIYITQNQSILHILNWNGDIRSTFDLNKQGLKRSYDFTRAIGASNGHIVIACSLNSGSVNAFEMFSISSEK